MSGPLPGREAVQEQESGEGVGNEGVLNLCCPYTAHRIRHFLKFSRSKEVRTGASSSSRAS